MKKPIAMRVQLSRSWNLINTQTFQQVVQRVTGKPVSIAVVVPSEGWGGPFGGLILCNTATPQEVLHCTHSQAHDPKEEWDGGTMECSM